MTDEVKDNLPELLKHITTLKKTSWDKQKREYMCESKMKVIDFDKIPKMRIILKDILVTYYLLKYAMCFTICE